MPTTIVKGVPYAADVSRIEERFPTMTPGTRICVSDVESCIHEPHSSSRFAAVQLRWRKQMEKKHNVIIARRRVKNGDAEPTPVFEVLDNPGRVFVARSQYKSGLKKVHHAGMRARSTGDSGLDSNTRRIRDHIATTSASLLHAMRTAAKVLNYPDPVKELE